MPICYSLIVSLSSSNDSESNQISAFHIVSEIQSDLREIIAPLQILSWWSCTPEEINQVFSIRLELYKEGNLIAHSPPLELVAETDKISLRLEGLPLPSENGDLQVYFACLSSQNDWVKSHAYWLISLDA